MRRLGGDLWLMLWTGKLFEGLVWVYVDTVWASVAGDWCYLLSLCYRSDDVDFGMENIHPSEF
jgi:hypothetical protein